MDATVNAVWGMLEKECCKRKNQYPNMIFHSDAKDIFSNRCRYWRNTLLKTFMKNDVMELDRHKIAAILTISIIESKAVSYDNEPSDKVFMGLQILAVTCGLSYMQSQLNNQLKQNGRSIEKYWMPEPFSCTTYYLEVMARNLYYEENASDEAGNKLWRLNPLQLANTYYFLELYTLEKEKIPTDIVKEL